MNRTRQVPHDPSLPGLADALNETRMAREFGALLDRSGEETGERYAVLSCAIIRVKYRPGRNAVIGYKLSIDARRSGAPREQFLCAGLYPAGQARSRYEQASATASINREPLPRVSLIDELGMLVWAFPNDRKLDTLPVLADVGRLERDLLRELVRDHWGESWRIAHVLHDVISYFPEHSCTVRANVTLAHAGDGSTRSWCIFGKTRYDDAGATTLKVMRDLWQSPARLRGELGLARPLGYQPRFRVLWQEEVSGVTLDEHIDARGLDAGLARRVGQSIAALHETRVRGPNSVTVESILEGLDETTRLLGLVRTESHARAAAVVRRLRADAATLTTSRRATLHGDLHAMNILVDANRVCLIDLDRVSEGPPLAELGSLVAEIHYRDLLARRSPRESVPLIQALLQGYSTQASWPAPMNEVNWYTAAALVRERVFRCLTSLKPGRLQIIDGLIELAAGMCRFADNPVSRVSHPVAPALSSPAS